MGYLNDKHMSLYIPCMLFHFSTATITDIAGQTAGTIVKHRAAADQTSLITIPIVVPSNSGANKGARVKSIEVDYEILVAEPTSITWTLNKVTRGTEGADATVAAVTKTDSLDAAGCITVDEHKQVITITTPFYLDDGDYLLLEAALVAGAGGNTADFLGAIVNYDYKL